MLKLNILITNLIRNKLLFWLGTSHFLLFVVLLAFSPFNDTIILGINALIKPMKFALSIWIYSWTMTLILNFVNDSKKVKNYSLVAVVCMSFEQLAITFQAWKGELSHFHNSSTFGIVLFLLMGVFILTITLWTAYITYIFIKQKKYALKPAEAMSIKLGLVYFVLFSLFGGYISALSGHTIGSSDGGKGLWFLNWNSLFGDLRVAHFFGIHSLQIIPLFAIFANQFLNDARSKKAVKIFASIYLIFILFTLIQGLMGLPFFK